MNARKIAEFILLKPAFNKKNISSLAFVAALFAAYVLSTGGSFFENIPKLEDGAGFGAVSLEKGNGVLVPEQAKEVLGMKDSTERLAREAAMSDSRLDLDKEEPVEPLDSSKLIQVDTTNYKEESKLRRLEQKPQRTLEEIEERLNIKRSK